MNQWLFKISFDYEIFAGSLHVALNADVELITPDTCYIHNIRRVHTIESPLLPVIQLKKVGGEWVHIEGYKGSNISHAIGHAIDLHLKRSGINRSEPKDS